MNTILDLLPLAGAAVLAIIGAVAVYKATRSTAAALAAAILLVLLISAGYVFASLKNSLGITDGD